MKQILFTLVFLTTITTVSAQQNLDELLASGVEDAQTFTQQYITPGAEGWQLSNPPILSMAAIKASLDMFNEVGMEALRKKSEQLTGYFEFLINELNNDKIKIITPTDPKQRGCQLSIQVKDADKSLHHKLTEANIITDWREPDVIRCAPVPLYNSFEDVFRMVEKLKEIL